MFVATASTALRSGSSKRSQAFVSRTHAQRPCLPQCARLPSNRATPAILSQDARFSTSVLAVETTLERTSWGTAVEAAAVWKIMALPSSLQTCVEIN